MNCARLDREGATLLGAQSKLRRRVSWGLILRLCFFSALSLWLSQSALISPALDALRALSLESLAIMVATLLLTQVAAALRWYASLRAFFQPTRSIQRLFALSLIGLFYNTWLPGAVGGDLLRAHLAHRGSTSQEDAADQSVEGAQRDIPWLTRFAPYLIVFFERGMGLITLISLAICAVAPAVGAVTLSLGAIFIYSLPQLKQIQEHSALRPESARWLVGAALCAYLAHGASILLFLIAAPDLGIELSLSAWMGCHPLSLIAANLPLSLFGVGARELTLIALLGGLGVDRALALALSLSVAGVIAITALLGALAHLVMPTEEHTPRESAL